MRRLSCRLARSSRSRRTTSPPLLSTESSTTCTGSHVPAVSVSDCLPKAVHSSTPLLSTNSSIIYGWFGDGAAKHQPRIACGQLSVKPLLSTMCFTVKRREKGISEL